MEKIILLESYIKNINNKQINKIDENNIINLLNEISKLDPKCLSENDYQNLIKCMPLTVYTYNSYNDEILAAGCNLIASLCSDDTARYYFGEQITVSSVNLLKSLASRMTRENCTQECLLQTCRAIGNLCYYHEENTKSALKEGCLLTIMDILRTNNEKNVQPVFVGLLLNLTHLDDYNYKFPDNMIIDLSLFGVKLMDFNNNNYRTFINLVSVMINIIKKTSSNNKITEFEKCYFIDHLLEKYYTQIDIASICIKFIKQVSKTYNIYNWILNGKYKALIKVLDKYERNEEEDAKHTVKKISDIIILLSNDDGSIDNNKQLEVLCLVEWLLLKINSSNLYVKLSAVRSLGNFSRFKYESTNHMTPAKMIIKHISWFINTLEKSVKEKNMLMEVSILCLFKNLLYVTNFKSMDENDADKMIKTTIDVLNHTTFNPIIMKSLDIIECIIKKSEIGEKKLILYKSSTFIKLVTTYCNSNDEDINKLAKKLLYSINEDINTLESDVLHSVEENLKIKN